MVKKLIAITGVTGVGKTYLLKKYAYPNTIYLDNYVKDVLYLKGTNVFKEVTRIFGKSIVAKNKINPQELGKIVWHDAHKLETLTKIVKPHIRDYLQSLKNEVYLIEMAIYIKHEAYFQDLFDEVVLIITNYPRMENKFNYLTKAIHPLPKQNIQYTYLVDRDQKNATSLFFKTLDKLISFKVS